jgi:DNA-binding CsgD family transcriptional regulator
MLLEREGELEALWSVVEAAGQRRGAVAIVEGEAGIGKTSLLEATADRAAEQGARVLRARGAALEREFGLGIVRQLFERPLLEAGEQARAALLAGAATPAATAIGTTSPHGDPPPGTDTAFAVQHGLYWLACNLADSAPVVLLVDDAQWSDVPSLRWLTYLAGRLDGVALAALVAWRSGEPDVPGDLLEALRSQPGARALAPRALSEPATTALVRSALGDVADARFCSTCHETSGGNPFLLRALVDALEGETVASTDAPARVRQLGPEAVRHSVLSRLSRLGEDAGALARAVSVLDTDAAPRFAYALARLGPARGARAAAALQAARIFDVDEALRFSHPIMRAAVYEDLPPHARAAEHRRAAQTLTELGGDADRAAVHLLATEPVGDLAVQERLRQAAERALSRGAPEMALTLLKRALTEDADPDRRSALLLAAGRAAQTLARPEAKTYLRDAHRQSAEPLLRADAAMELARTIWHGRPGEAAAALRTAIADVPGDEQERRDRVRLELLMIETTTGARAAHEVEAELRELHRAAAPGSPARLGAACVLTWHQELWNERPETAGFAALAQDLLDVGPLVDAYGADFTPIAYAATVLADLDQLATADVMLELAIEAAARTGSALAFNQAVTCRAAHAAHRGDFAGAQADARAVLDNVTLTGSWSGRRAASYPLVWALTGRGAYEEAETTLAAHGLDRETGRSLGIDTNLLIARSILRLHQGRHAEAGDDIAHALEQRRWPNPLSRINTWAPRVLAAAGEPDRAREIAARAVAAARAGGFRGPLGIALHSTGLAERGERAVEVLAEAADVLAQSPWRWEHAETLADLGAALRRANRRAEAREPLSRALELATEIEALALAERAREELRATGARSRNVLRTGLDSLTASERRVAAMAADGLTISEMAQRLFVTRKTIETHLYASYRKLDVNSRDALAAVLTRGE